MSTEEVTPVDAGGRVTQRDLYDAIAALRNEISTTNGRLEGKLDLFISQHNGQHQAEQERVGARIRALEDWHTETRAYGTLLKWTFGASALGAVLGLLSLLDIVSHLGA
jgi:hypothetical protein